MSHLEHQIHWPGGLVVQSSAGDLTPTSHVPTPCTCGPPEPTLKPLVHPMKLTAKVVQWKRRSLRSRRELYRKKVSADNSKEDVMCSVFSNSSKPVSPPTKSRSQVSVLTYPLQNCATSGTYVIAPRDKSLRNSHTVQPTGTGSKMSRVKWIDALGRWIPDDQTTAGLSKQITAPAGLTKAMSSAADTINTMTSQFPEKSESSSSCNEITSSMHKTFKDGKKQYVNRKSTNGAGNMPVLPTNERALQHNQREHLSSSEKSAKASILTDKLPSTKLNVPQIYVGPDQVKFQATFIDKPEVFKNRRAQSIRSLCREDMPTGKLTETVDNAQTATARGNVKQTSAQKLKKNRTRVTNPRDGNKRKLLSQAPQKDLRKEADNCNWEDQTLVRLIGRANGTEPDDQALEDKDRHISMKQLHSDTSADTPLCKSSGKRGLRAQRANSGNEQTGQCTQEHELSHVYNDVIESGPSGDFKLWTVPELPNVNSDSRETKVFGLKNAASLIGPKNARFVRQSRQMDPDFLKDTFLQSLAEERRRKLYFGFTKKKSRFNLNAPVRPWDNSGSLEYSELDDYLLPFCIFQDDSLARFQQVFNAFDDKRRGWINHRETLRALLVVNSGMAGTDLDYLYRILELMKCDINKGTNVHVFSILCALSQKVATIDSWIKLKSREPSTQVLDMKVFLCKRLWEICIDQDKKAITADQLLVLLRSGGLSDQHQASIKEKFSHTPCIDYLTFLTYAPLFVTLHQSVVQCPLSDVRDK